MADENEGQGIDMKMEAPEKKPNTALWIILTIAISGIIFGAGGYWLGKNKTVDKGSVDLLTATVTATASTSATTSADVTANWKTYTNDAYGFSFKYPSNYKVADDSADINNRITILGLDTEKNYIQILSGTTDRGGEGFETLSSTVISANGISWKVIYSQGVNNSDFGDNSNSKSINADYSKSTNNSFAFIAHYQKENSSEIETVFPQILSTFQFTK